jgi:DNA primase
MIAARSRRLPAIALPGVQSWRPEWASLFAERQVTIIMDADPAGRESAARINQDLRTVAAVRILDLAPGRNDGYDLTNWLPANRPIAQGR